MTQENSVFRVQQGVLHIWNDSKQTIYHIKGEDGRDSYPYLMVLERGRVKIFKNVVLELTEEKENTWYWEGLVVVEIGKELKKRVRSGVIKMHYTFVWKSQSAIKKHLFFIFMYVCAHTQWCPRRLNKSVTVPAAKVTNTCELPNVYLWACLSPLKEEQAISTT